MFNKELNISRFTREGARFVSIGIANTLIGIIIYQAGLFVLSPQLSYTLSWIIGIFLVVIVYPSYVFKKKSTATSKKFVIICLYIFSFIISSLLLNFLVIFVGIHSRISIFIVLGLSTILNFVGMRLVVL